MKIYSSVEQHVGHIRRDQQDSYFLQEGLSLYSVFDGMGGQSGGERASRTASDALTRRAQQILDGGSRRMPELFNRFVGETDKLIHAIGVQEPQLAGLGTTAAALVVHNSEATETMVPVSVALVGDSRVYLRRKGQLYQMGMDQSWINMRIRLGYYPTPEEKAQLSNAIARSLGSGTNDTADIYTFDAQKGDLFILCSDGLNSMVRHDGINEIINRTLAQKSGEGLGGAGLVQAISQELVRVALDNGGEDNVTVLVVGLGTPQVGGVSPLDAQWFYGNVSDRRLSAIEPRDVITIMERCSAGTFFASPFDNPFYAHDLESFQNFCTNHARKLPQGLHPQENGDLLPKGVRAQVDRLAAIVNKELLQRQKNGTDTLVTRADVSMHHLAVQQVASSSSNVIVAQTPGKALSRSELILHAARTNRLKASVAAIVGAVLLGLTAYLVWHLLRLGKGGHTTANPSVTSSLVEALSPTAHDNGTPAERLWKSFDSIHQDGTLLLQRNEWQALLPEELSVMDFMGRFDKPWTEIFIGDLRGGFDLGAEKEKKLSPRGVAELYNGKALAILYSFDFERPPEGMLSIEQQDSLAEALGFLQASQRAMPDFVPAHLNELSLLTLAHRYKAKLAGTNIAPEKPITPLLQSLSDPLSPLVVATYLLEVPNKPQDAIPFLGRSLQKNTLLPDGHLLLALALGRKTQVPPDVFNSVGLSSHGSETSDALAVLGEMVRRESTYRRMFRPDPRVYFPRRNTLVGKDKILAPLGSVMTSAQKKWVSCYIEFATKKLPQKELECPERTLFDKEVLKFEEGNANPVQLTGFTREILMSFRLTDNKHIKIQENLPRLKEADTRKIYNSYSSLAAIFLEEFVGSLKPEQVALRVEQEVLVQDPHFWPAEKALRDKSVKNAFALGM